MAIRTIIQRWGSGLSLTGAAMNRLPGSARCVGALNNPTLWFSREARNAGMTQIMNDPPMRDNPRPFDGGRLIYGEFQMILDE